MVCAALLFALFSSLFLLVLVNIGPASGLHVATECIAKTAKAKSAPPWRHVRAMDTSTARTSSWDSIVKGCSVPVERPEISPEQGLRARAVFVSLNIKGSLGCTSSALVVWP